MIIKILGLAAISFLFVNSQPTVYLKEKLFGFNDNWFIQLINCSLCSGFWIGLAFTFNIYEAAIVSVLAQLIENTLNNRL